MDSNQKVRDSYGTSALRSTSPHPAKEDRAMLSKFGKLPSNESPVEAFSDKPARYEESEDDSDSVSVSQPE